MLITRKHSTAADQCCWSVVAQSLSGTLVETLDHLDSLSADDRLPCLNALKMTVYLLCQMCELYELSFAKPAAVTAVSKVKCSDNFQCFTFFCFGILKSIHAIKIPDPTNYTLKLCSVKSKNMS